MGSNTVNVTVHVTPEMQLEFEWTLLYNVDVNRWEISCDRSFTNAKAGL